jgi:hypothetical protein
MPNALSVDASSHLGYSSPQHDRAALQGVECGLVRALTIRPARPDTENARP